MQKFYSLKPSSFFTDATIFLAVVVAIYGLIAFSAEWNSSFNPTYNIELSLHALPLYTFFSALRGSIAYIISLTFTLVIGFWASRSEKAERLIVPFLDIMQSIPVLGFLPGLVLGLVAIFPHTNVGLELAAILMIFTGQVWNMTFAFYSSLKSVPVNLKEAAAVMKLSVIGRLRFLELPFSAMNLTWNSLMSMAGGWFFLTVCEAFTLGDRTYRLPGLGAYMAVAIEQSNTRAIFAGIFAMALVIVFFDVVLWRPALAWAHHYRLEETQGQIISDPFIRLIVRDSFVYKIIKLYRHRQSRKKKSENSPWMKWRNFKRPKFIQAIFDNRVIFLWLGYLTLASVAGLALFRLYFLLVALPFSKWIEIFRDTGFTLLRVFGAVLIGTMWATPVGIWIAQSPKRLKIAQPIIQMFASFPAPMLYPLAIGVLLFLRVNFEVSAMVLMLLGVQWYILFNVLAGALKIPIELQDAMRLMGSSNWQMWRYLFIPSVFPSLVTGWVTAAGGAWNASIVSEIVVYKGQSLSAHGLGAQISRAAEHADFSTLAACLVVMVVAVVLLNRTLWAKIYRVAQTRFRMDF